MENNQSKISLKWGTLKSWDLKKQEEKDLVQKYIELGCSISAMCQNDSPEQKEILCKLIDIISGDIYLEWDRKYVSKEEAKEYILKYDKE